MLSPELLCLSSPLLPRAAQAACVARDCHQNQPGLALVKRTISTRPASRGPQALAGVASSNCFVSAAPGASGTVPVPGMRGQRGSCLSWPCAATHSSLWTVPLLTKKLFYLHEKEKLFSFSGLFTQCSPFYNHAASSLRGTLKENITPTCVFLQAPTHLSKLADNSHLATVCSYIK